MAVPPQTRWTGAVTYQGNLFEALTRHQAQVQLYILTEDGPDAGLRDHHYNVINYPVLKERSPRKILNDLACRLFRHDPLLQKALRNASNGGIDVLMTPYTRYIFVGDQTAILFWIPDFQHVRLPEMFTAYELRERDMAFKLGIKRSTLVVVSSHDTQKDFCRFMPEHSHKARVMSFVAFVPEHIYSLDPRSVVVKYSLPEKFFYLPNQFWKHKNHIIVLEAMKLLRPRGIKPFVVCTGSTSDYRHPSHFADLLNKISLWGLRNQIALLGFVKDEDVHLLVRQSVCVINPSLSEGWSTVVEEVKSVGKRILLSQLAVHLEQAAPKAIYFDPHDAEDLANKLEQIWADSVPGPDFELEEIARSNLPKRMKTYAETFLSIATEAVEISKGRL